MVDDRVVRIAQPELSAAQRPFGVLVIDEKVLIHHADSLDIVLRHEHRRASDNVQGRLNFLGTRADLSSISITLNPEMLAGQLAKPEEAKAWDPGEIAAKAWNASLEMLSGIATVAITVIVFFWWMIPLLLIALLVLVRTRRRGVDGTPPAPPAAPAPVGEASA